MAGVTMFLLKITQKNRKDIHLDSFTVFDKFLRLVEMVGNEK